MKKSLLCVYMSHVKGKFECFKKILLCKCFNGYHQNFQKPEVKYNIFKFRKKNCLNLNAEKTLRKDKQHIIFLTIFL